MQKKIFKQSLMVTLITLFLAVLLMGFVIFSQLQQRFFDDLKNEATAITKVWNDEGTAGLARVVSTERLTLVDALGNVVLDNQAKVGAMENHNNRPEIIAARKKGTGISQRNSDTLLSKNFYFAKKLSAGYVLRLATTEESFVALYLRFIWPLVGIVMGAALLAYFFSRRAAKQLVRPINTLNLDAPEKNNSYAELQPLVKRLAEQNKKISQQMRDIQAKERQLTLITNNMNEGILLVDAQQNSLIANPVAREILHLSADEKKPLSLIFQDFPEILAVLAKKNQSNSQEVTFETGEQMYRLSFNTIFEEEKIIGRVLLFFDITAAATQETLRREFTANVTHELKTPLTSISGYAEIIHAGIVKKEDIPGFAERIYDEAQRLIALVNDILHLSNLESSKQREKMVINWPELVGQIQKTLALPLEHKKQTLKVAYLGDLAYRGYPQVLQDILYNLIENASKYSPAQTTITLKIQKNEQSLVLLVSDEGPGIPLAERERIFERFYRIDKSHSPQVSGTGLGLAIVKHGVQLHRGRVEILPNPRGGTTFCVSLPLTK